MYYINLSLLNVTLDFSVTQFYLLISNNFTVLAIVRNEFTKKLNIPFIIILDKLLDIFNMIYD